MYCVCFQSIVCGVVLSYRLHYLDFSKFFRSMSNLLATLLRSINIGFTNSITAILLMSKICTIYLEAMIFDNSRKNVITSSFKTRIISITSLCALLNWQNEEDTFLLWKLIWHFYEFLCFENLFKNFIYRLEQFEF